MIGLLTREKTVKVASTEELLHALIEYSKPFVRSNFSQVGDSYVYNKPLKSSRQVLSDGHYVDDQGAVIKLNLRQQLMLLHLLSQKYGLQLRHGSLEENFEATYSQNGEEYRRNVLDPYWVFTREMIGPNGVYQTLGIEELKQPQAQLPYKLVSEGKLLIPVPQLSSESQIKLTDEPMQKDVPTKTGYFDQFKGVIPINREIRSQRFQHGKGYWNGIQPDEYGWSAVGCVWVSVELGLLAFAGWPLLRYFVGALGIWADEI